MIILYTGFFTLQKVWLQAEVIPSEFWWSSLLWVSLKWWKVVYCCFTTMTCEWLFNVNTYIASQLLQVVCRFIFCPETVIPLFFPKDVFSPCKNIACKRLTMYCVTHFSKLFRKLLEQRCFQRKIFFNFQVYLHLQI